MPTPPVAVSLTLCDYVIVEERTKKISLIGTFTGLKVADFPATPHPFSVFAVLTDGIGDVTIDLSVTQLATNEEVAIHQGRMRFPDKLAEVSYHARLHHCTFPAPGVYQFTLLADGEWVAHRRLRVYSAEEQP
jgi:hypothetical protein